MIDIKNVLCIKMTSYSQCWSEKWITRKNQAKYTELQGNMIQQYEKVPPPTYTSTMQNYGQAPNQKYDNVSHITFNTE
jgi:hypothetical protein